MGINIFSTLNDLCLGGGYNLQLFSFSMFFYLFVYFFKSYEALFTLKKKKKKERMFLLKEKHKIKTTQNSIQVIVLL